jgi:5-carboxymethyl-2-hydroxymuconate isomerase
MPHLTIEYSANVDGDFDMQALCDVMRDAMVETGIFPLGGIRVRAFPCGTYTIADSNPAHGYIHMICRVGAGREESVRLEAAEAFYAAAESFLRVHVQDRPLALSLDLDELHPVTSLKHYNTIHAALKS